MAQLGFFAQNNCEMVESEPKEVIKEAWKYYSNYLHWEDEKSDIFRYCRIKLRIKLRIKV